MFERLEVIFKAAHCSAKGMEIITKSIKFESWRP